MSWVWVYDIVVAGIILFILFIVLMRKWAHSKSVVRQYFR